MSRHPYASFVVDQATRLIAAGGAYRDCSLGDVIEIVLLEIEGVHDYFVNGDDMPDEPETGGPH
jgi:hypothetical protein